MPKSDWWILQLHTLASSLTVSVLKVEVKQGQEKWFYDGTQSSETENKQLANFYVGLQVKSSWLEGHFCYYTQWLISYKL